MKNYVSGICFLLIIATSCKKVDNSSVFDKSPDQRLTEALTAYQAKLTGAQYGWKATITTGIGGIYTFYFQFNDSNRVKMLSSFDSTSAVTLKESSYRLKALQQPSLIFDTYSYIHVLADPTGAVNGGITGAGLISDFEFYFDDSTTTANQVGLRGRFNGSKMILTRNTQQEGNAFLTGQLAAGLAINKILTYYKRIVINGTDSTDAFVNTQLAIFRRPDAQGNLLDASRITQYSLALGGLAFATPLVVGTKTISEISNINFNVATNTITATAGGTPIVIKEVVVPIKVDVAAPARWWNYSVSQASYYGSSLGFHVNGRDDAFNWRSFAGYAFIYFEAKYGTSGGITYDLLGPVINNALNYGAAYRPPNFTADGRVIYAFFGTLGTVPAAQNAAFVSTRNQLAIPQGYYLVQISALDYDMVSAADGKAWITWEW